MLSGKMYTNEYIRELQNRTGNDPALLERVVYPLYKDGISRIRNHILGGKFSGEIAGVHASRVLYLAASIFTSQKTIMKIEDVSMYTGIKPEIEKAKRFSYLRAVAVSPGARSSYDDAVWEIVRGTCPNSGTNGMEKRTVSRPHFSSTH